MLQEAAIAHTEELGMGREKTLERLAQFRTGHEEETRQREKARAEPGGVVGRQAVEARPCGGEGHEHAVDEKALGVGGHPVRFVFTAREHASREELVLAFGRLERKRAAQAIADFHHAGMDVHLRRGGSDASGSPRGNRHVAHPLLSHVDDEPPPLVVVPKRFQPAGQRLFGASQVWWN